MADDRRDLYDDDEHFDEFNPHPYRGGYDIALTYGDPLPPSASTCYSITSAAAASPLPPPPPPSPHPQPSDPPRLDGADPDGSPAPPITHTGSPWNGIVDLFGFWYVGAGFRGGAPEEPWFSAADYLFGYLPFHGPKRHESHNFGNLNYAYEMRRPSSPISVQIHPDPRPGEVDCSGIYGFGSSSSSPGYLFARGEEEKGPVSAIEPSWSVEAPPSLPPGMCANVEARLADDLFAWWPSANGGAEYHREQAIEEPRYLCSYATNFQSMPMAVEVEPSWTYGLHHHEEVAESDCGYERRIFELPMGAQVEPAEQLSSFDCESFVEQLFRHGREDVGYATTNCEEEEPLPVEIERSVPAWSRDPCYREFYQQSAYQDFKHENEYNDEYHGHTYWPF